MHKNHKGREKALKALYSYDISKNVSEEILMDEDKEIENFSREIVNGVIKNSKEIDSLISKHLKNWKIERLGVIEKNILRIATYELLFKDEIPAAIIIDEAVELAKEYGNENSSSFVNGILDCILHKEIGNRLIKTK